jgi:hypothetical protein
MKKKRNPVSFEMLDNLPERPNRKAIQSANPTKLYRTQVLAKKQN